MVKHEGGAREPDQEANQNPAAHENGNEKDEAGERYGAAKPMPGEGQPRPKCDWEQKVIPEFIRQAPKRTIRTEELTKNRLQKKEIAEEGAGVEISQRHGKPEIGERMGVNFFGGEKPATQAVPEKSEK
jgi:hypothetical protein